MPGKTRPKVIGVLTYRCLKHTENSPITCGPKTACFRVYLTTSPLKHKFRNETRYRQTEFNCKVCPTFFRNLVHFGHRRLTITSRIAHGALGGHQMSTAPYFSSCRLLIIYLFSRGRLSTVQQACLLLMCSESRRNCCLNLVQCVCTY